MEIGTNKSYWITSIFTYGYEPMPALSAIAFKMLEGAGTSILSRYLKVFYYQNLRENRLIK
ncbi:hypothetical protein EQO05_11990 [Methanosarcina sp. MSH10X1]|nr:hypothetical protein EQO05_11990 [Methanosarcina sp. MSH10X1]